MKNEKPTFTYTIFPASQITGNAKHKTEIMADLDLVKTAFVYATELTGSDTILFTTNSNIGTFALKDSHLPDSSDKDVRTEHMEKRQILSLIIELHGGAVVSHNDEWQVSIPLKPARKK
ncbi:hypothetical protein HYS00_01140 [Candidatus Microgenomates bacterium]|nr:hypothetical protein [Candidatus Microgenomates bacterium]